MDDLQAHDTDHEAHRGRIHKLEVRFYVVVGSLLAALMGRTLIELGGVFGG